MKTKKTKEYVFSKEISESKIVKKEFTNSPGLTRIFIEVLSNAIDNVQRSKTFKVPCKKIKVNIAKETGETKVWNDGLYIPITRDETQTDLLHRIKLVVNPNLI